MYILLDASVNPHQEHPTPPLVAWSWVIQHPPCFPCTIHHMLWLSFSSTTIHWRFKMIWILKLRLFIFTKLHQTSPNFTKIAQADCFALGQLGQLGPQRAGCDHGSNAWGNSVDWIEIAGIITKDFAGHFRSRNVSKCLEDSWRLADLRDSPNWKKHPKSSQISTKWMEQEGLSARTKRRHQFV